MREAGGVGTYLSEILSQWEKAGKDFFQLTPEKVKAPIYSIREQIELPLKAPRSDLFWAPHFNVPLLPHQSKRLITTIHDTYHLDHLCEFSIPKQLYTKLMFRVATRRSDKIITVSEFSKSRLLKHFPEIEQKIEVIFSGCDHLPVEGKEPKAKPPAPYYLFVGNLKPHKNLKCVLQAMEEVEGSHLVVVGKMSGFIHGIDLEKLKQEFPRLKKRLHFVGKVPVDELSWYYQNAMGLIFPSFYEGWGLPPLEAMRLGCPVIASSAASIPEACGDAALYFNPLNPKELTKRMIHLSSQRDEWIDRGITHSASFTWKKTAEKHSEVISKTAVFSRDDYFFY